MKTYKNSPEGFRDIKKRVLFILIPLLLIMLAVSSGFGEGFNMVSSVPLIVIMGAAFTFSIVRALNRQRKLYKSYLLIINDNDIQREQDMTPLITLKKNEIAEIVKCRNGSIMIKGQKKHDVIIVSKHIANREALESDLQKMMEFKVQSGKGIREKMQVLIIPILLGLMAAIVISTNKYLVLISAAIVTIIFGWSLYEVQINKNIDARTKRNSWLIIIVILVMITIVYSKVLR
jgi:hypothetical protein